MDGEKADFSFWKRAKQEQYQSSNARPAPQRVFRRRDRISPEVHVMWICSCHAVTDGMIKEFAKQHGCAWKKMTQELKVGTQCGTCAKSAKEILEQAAGKPKRKRVKKQKPSGETLQTGVPADLTATSAPTPTVSSSADPQSANVGADDAKLSTDKSPTSAQTPSPAFLPCGKCTCICGK